MSLIVRASAVKSRSIRWAWAGRLPVGYLTVLTGVEGLGKSLFAAWLIARATRGELPGEWEGQPVDVLVIAGEDGIADTWRPRLDLAGADPDRVAFLDVARLAPGWNLRDNIEDIRAAIGEMNAKLLWIDAALDHLPPTRAGEASQPTFVRQALNPLKHLVRELEIAAQYSMHPPKARSGNFRDLVQLSQAFSAIPRVGLLFDYHPDDHPEDPDRRRVLIRGKGNLGRNPGALSFRVDAVPYRHDDGRTTKRERVIDVQPCSVTLADLAPDRVVGVKREPTKTEQAEAVMRERLAGGGWHLAAPIRAALEGSDSVVREAKRKAGVRSRKRPGAQDGPWEWSIPSENGSHDALTPSPPRARCLSVQDAFDFEGENGNEDGKASRRHGAESGEGESGRRLDGEGLRARAPGPLVGPTLARFGGDK